MKNSYNYKVCCSAAKQFMALAVLLTITSLSTAFAQQQTLPIQEKSRAAERIYIATDRDAYVAGETIWISMYCLDINDSLNLSNISGIAYLELHNAKSLVITAKVALIVGRGSGHIELPPNLPTGNYKIVSYTKQMLNEKEPVLFEKIIPIYSALSSERVDSTVIPGANAISSSSSLSLSNLGHQNVLDVKFGTSGRVLFVDSSFMFTLSNQGESIVSANISVYKQDSLSNNYKSTIVSYLATLPKAVPLFTNKFIPEYEGEIIWGRVICDNNKALWDRAIFLSAAGGNSDLYSTSIDSTGSFAFFTTPFFGNRDLILEIPRADSTLNITYELQDPFIRDRVGDIPSLLLDTNIASSLKERAIEMQLGRRFGIDTLYERLPINKDPLLLNNAVVYRLDDYTRFTVMQEVVTEYIPELRFRKVDKKTDLQVRVDNAFKDMSFSKEYTLALLDGVPVFDHQKILDYNPLKVETISIYKSDYFVGVAGFSGVASFRTYKGDYSGLTFGKNVRIVDYQGELYPSKLHASGVHSIKNLPDMRSLLYWDPIVSLTPGEEKEITVYTSAVAGNYIIRVEGISSKGIPIIFSAEFVVK